MAFSFLLIFTNIYHATKMGRCAGSRDYVRGRSHASSSFFLPSIVHFLSLTFLYLPTLLFCLQTRQELWRSKGAYIYACFFVLPTWLASCHFDRISKREKKERKLRIRECGLCVYMDLVEMYIIWPLFASKVLLLRCSFSSMSVCDKVMITYVLGNYVVYNSAR
jgi:hypothetical protein